MNNDLLILNSESDARILKSLSSIVEHLLSLIILSGALAPFYEYPFPNYVGYISVPVAFILLILLMRRNIRITDERFEKIPYEKSADDDFPIMSTVADLQSLMKHLNKNIEYLYYQFIVVIGWTMLLLPLLLLNWVLSLFAVTLLEFSTGITWLLVILGLLGTILNGTIIGTFNVSRKSRQIASKLEGLPFGNDDTQ